MGSHAHWRGPAAIMRAQPHDVLISGVERVEDIGGGLYRFVLYINRQTADGGVERVPSPDGDVVVPGTAIPDGIGKALLAIGRKVVACEDRLIVMH